MSLEKKILAACMHSRAAFDRIEGELEGRISLPVSDFIVEMCKEYYARDGTADSVDIDYVMEHISNLFDNPKKVVEFQGIVREINDINVSAENIVDLILAARQKEAGHKLAAALANGDKDVDELWDEYKSVSTRQTKAVEEEEVFQNVSIEQSINTVLNPANLIHLPTQFLMEATDGGALPGHQILVYARPETGKSALAIAFAKCFAYQGLPGIYFGNEDPIQSIILRAQCAISGMTKEQLRQHPKDAQALLEANGWGNIRFIPLHPGSPEQVRKYVKMYGAKWFVSDQMRNYITKADTRVNQLETAATALRNIAGQEGAVSVALTQAGDSAERKLVLDMGDVDFSNTGIPSQMDLMVGMGVNEDFESKGYRMLSLPKNKLGGKHVHGAIRLNPFTSQIEDL